MFESPGSVSGKVGRLLRGSVILRFLTALAAPMSGLPAQEPPTEQPALRGTVVREDASTLVAGAQVEPFRSLRNPPAITDELGRFVIREAAPKCFASNATNTQTYDLVDYLVITALGTARTFVDPCSTAPWADPVRLRPVAALRGRFTSSGAGHRICAVAPWQDLCWPPRTGLTRVDARWFADLDGEGRFEFAELPAQVPLSIRFEAGVTAAGLKLVEDLVLQPGEVREIELSAPTPSGPEASPGPTTQDEPWIPLEITANGRGTSRGLAAFEILEGGRFMPHKVGGGRWHVHGSRPCNHLEALPGARTLIARDPEGWFGLETIEILPTDPRVVRQIEMSPGALVRIHFDGPEERARISLDHEGVRFVSREVRRGILWYELVPTGKVTASVAAQHSEARTSTLEITAGTIVTLGL